MPSTAERIARCLLGLVVLGFGIALMVAADLGLSPWEVLHQGISERTGVPIGTVGILVGVLVLGAWIPLRQRPGLGTVLNVIVIGVTIDLTLLWLDTPGSMATRLGYLLLGALAWGPGSGLYIGARLGAGPRDGLMTGLAARGLPVGRVRFGLEVVVLVAGAALGGTVGLGTVVFAVSIGPGVAFFLPRLSVGEADAPSAVPAAARRPR